MEMTLSTIEDLFYEYADLRYNGDVTIFREAGIFKVGFGKLTRDSLSLRKGESLKEAMTLCLEKSGIILFNNRYKLDQVMDKLVISTEGAWRLQPNPENMNELELYDDVSETKSSKPILTVNLSDEDNDFSLKKLEDLQLMIAAPYMFYLLKDCLGVEEVRKNDALANRIVNCLMPIVQEPINTENNSL